MKITIYCKNSKNRKKIINKPIVGIVVTTSPNFSLYKTVVLPAASSPTKTVKIYIKKSLKNTFKN